MPPRARGLLLSVAAVVAVAPALADPAPPAAPAPPAPAAPPATPAPSAKPADAKPADAKPAPAAPPRPKLAPRPKAPPPEALPDPDLHVRVVAPSAQGLWTLRIENDGARWVRVPADLRLLELTVESSDTMNKRRPKPIVCRVPASMRPESFPERNALLLGPGDAYVETFDPHLLCFGKDAPAVAGGALVRVRYGWDTPKYTKKVGPPFAVEGTTFPPSIEPKKNVVGPTMVLSYRAPEPDDEPEPPKPDAEDAAAPPSAPEAAAPTPVAMHTGGPEAPAKPADATSADKDKDKDKDKEGASDAKKEEVALPFDENAPRIEVTATPYVDARNGFAVTVNVTATNVGHRPAIAAIRSRMVAFRVEGPDGVTSCPSALPSHALPRDAYHTIKPGGTSVLTILVAEACSRDLFRRPGLYRVTPTLNLEESGSERGMRAITGVFRAQEPTMVRIADGPDPFYKSPPKATRAPAPEHAAPEHEDGGS